MDENSQKPQQFVIYPYENGVSDNLTPDDRLVYLILRQYMNKDTMSAYPSYATLNKDYNVTAKTVKKCVDNLVREKYLKVEKKGRKITYYFNNKKQFEAFSYDFLKNKDLDFNEKSYLVSAQRYMYKEGEEGLISLPNRELARMINSSTATVSRTNCSLEDKGYLINSDQNIKRFQLRKMDQLFLLKLCEHEEMIARNMMDIHDLKEQISSLKDDLKRELLRELKRDLKKELKKDYESKRPYEYRML